MKWLDRLVNRKPTTTELLETLEKQRTRELEELQEEMNAAQRKAELAAQMAEESLKAVRYYSDSLQGLAEALAKLGIDTPLKHRGPEMGRGVQLRHLFAARLAIESFVSGQDRDRKFDLLLARAYVSAATTALVNLDPSVYEQYQSWVAQQSHPIVCATCFSRFGEFSLELVPGGNVHYQGCPRCHTLEPYFEGIGRIIVVVDHAMVAHSAVDNSVLSVNWLATKEPGDLDEVLIRDGDDADVEELVMKLRNDTEEKRRKRYRSLPIRLGPTLRLSQAKINLLKGTFGPVQVGNV